MADLTQERLRQVLRYDQETGKCFWLQRAAHRRNPGDEAGCPSKDGRIRIRIDNQLFYRYRLAWLYMTGSWPQQKVDHINGDHTDDRWKNLRDVSQTVNCQNRRAASKTSKSGLLGVETTKNGKFKAAIRIPGKRISLGTFATAEEAHSTYMNAKHELHREAMTTKEHQ